MANVVAPWNAVAESADEDTLLNYWAVDEANGPAWLKRFRSLTLPIQLVGQT